MRYVILRDDDTCALTPPECLEQLYRPFLARGLPVSLGVIPDVCTDARRADGTREGFLQFNHGTTTPLVPIGQNRALTQYLRGERLYHVLHHGYDHSYLEFDCSRREAERRLAAGAQRLAAAGFPRPWAFVAPYDRFSSAALQAAAGRYPVVSAGWFEWRRTPPAWWPAYVLKRWHGEAHWRAGGALLLSHPGCLLSRYRPLEGMLARVRAAVQSAPLTVLVTHWWEYFRERRPDQAFIDVLHRTADFLAGDPDIRVISFADLATGRAAVPGLAPGATRGRSALRLGSGAAPVGPRACWSGAGRSPVPGP
ncbi:MAG TPA: DUF2334 domain-containing protein [Opitutaceae bacterium]|nr:DUF2334 domain-containing protein [Opitutaceae bacterium]